MLHLLTTLAFTENISSLVSFNPLNPKCWGHPLCRAKRITCGRLRAILQPFQLKGFSQPVRKEAALANFYLQASDLVPLIKIYLLSFLPVSVQFKLPLLTARAQFAFCLGSGFISLFSSFSQIVHFYEGSQRSLAYHCQCLKRPKPFLFAKQIFPSANI